MPPEPAATKMLTSEGDKLLERLSEIRKQDKKNQEVWESLDHHSFRRLDKPFKDVMQARHEACRTSLHLFKALVRRSEKQISSSLAIVVEDRIGDHENPERRLWLEQHENEVRGDKTFIDSNATHELRRREETQQQLDIFETKLLSQQRKWRKALKLVLKFKARKHAEEEEVVAGAMRRLAQPSFPTELLLKVIEPLVESQLPFCSITESDKLKVIIGKCFVWPQSITNGTRKLLLQTATRAFFKLSRVKLPGGLGPTLPVLGAMKTHLRRLVLDIQSTSRDSAIYSVLNNLTNTMSSLAKLFPRLSVCVCLIHFTEEGQVKPRVPRQSFSATSSKPQTGRAG